MKTLLIVLICTAADVWAACDNRWEAAGSTCARGPQPGATRLANYLKNNFGGRTEIYNCRHIGVSSIDSLHAEGRAIDHYVTGSVGTNVFNRMQGYPGVQEVIFNRKIWTKANGVHAYNGGSPHTDHVHVGLNWCGARG